MIYIRQSLSLSKADQQDCCIFNLYSRIS